MYTDEIIRNHSLLITSLKTIEPICSDKTKTHHTLQMQLIPSVAGRILNIYIRSPKVVSLKAAHYVN